jgi:hypothetical protein
MTSEAPASEKKWYKVLWAFTLKYPLAIVGTIFLVALAIFLIIFGQKFQIRGLLGRLWGRKPVVDPNVRVIPPPGRVDTGGVLIPAGKSDDLGYVQSPVQVVIKDPGVFDDPNIIIVNHPEKGDIVIPLPTGVKNEDVKQVVEIEPNVYQLSNNDKPLVNAGSLLDELEKKP